jgi:hypothetical protein
MKPPHAFGLGEPEPIGKRTLFRPSHENEKKEPPYPPKSEQGSRRRVRTTIELSTHALAIIQQLQNRHRLTTGKVLPLWKLVCQAIEAYGKSTNTDEIDSSH